MPSQKREQMTELLPSLHGLPENRTTSSAIAPKRATETASAVLYEQSHAPQQEAEDYRQKWPESSIGEAIYATPSVCKQAGGRRWLRLRCSHTQKLFGGLYSTAECDQILEHFKDRRHQIEPHEFNPIADRAIALCTQQTGAAR